jgi:hypothetical protein
MRRAPIAHEIDRLIPLARPKCRVAGFLKGVFDDVARPDARPAPGKTRVFVSRRRAV